MVQLTIKVQILQDPEDDNLADSAGSAGIEHPQNHPSSELSIALLQFNFIVQDEPVENRFETARENNDAAW
jgi:hypothetical protein